MKREGGIKEEMVERGWKGEGGKREEGEGVRGRKTREFVVDSWGNMCFS